MCICRCVAWRFLMRIIQKIHQISKKIFLEYSFPFQQAYFYYFCIHSKYYWWLKWKKCPLQRINYNLPLLWDKKQTKEEERGEASNFYGGMHHYKELFLPSQNGKGMWLFSSAPCPLICYVLSAHCHETSSGQSKYPAWS